MGKIKIKKLREHYEKLFSIYKDSFKTAQQSSRFTQEKRMLILVDRINFDNNSKVLDFGYGKGHLYNLLKKKKI